MALRILRVTLAISLTCLWVFGLMASASINPQVHEGGGWAMRGSS